MRTGGCSTATRCCAAGRPAAARLPRARCRACSFHPASYRWTLTAASSASTRFQSCWAQGERHECGSVGSGELYGGRGGVRCWRRREESPVDA
eukprot:354423-Chlamydomonas_euryale.AAC.12